MNYVKPIKLEKITLKNNLVQAPLAGYSCAPFRVLTTRFGSPGFCTTEMTSAKGLLVQRKKLKRYTWRDPKEGPLCYQLSAEDPEVLGQATALLSKEGADMIDLNCGCPVAKVRNKNCGSKLLDDPDRIYALAKAMKENTDGTVSIKIRVSSKNRDHDLEVIKAAEAGGVDFITVHGRHWTERYNIDCRLDAIANIVKHARVPIIANGDIECPSSFIRTMEITGCAGVMIGRASVGQPWLFEEIRAFCENRPFTKPSFSEIAEIFLEHLDRLTDLENEHLAVLQARKLVKYYAREIPKRVDFTVAMQKATKRSEAETLIRTYFR